MPTDSSSATRRVLTFTSLGQVGPDVARLLEGHTTVGRWSLAQICNHLELAIRLSMDGVPVKGPWWMRRLLGPVALRFSLGLGWIPEGVRVPEIYLPPEKLDAHAEFRALEKAIERLETFAGQCDEHPLLGRLSLAAWKRFHCVHCAHHLSFAIPAARP
jgi:hypothetical protein